MAGTWFVLSLSLLMVYARNASVFTVYRSTSTTTAFYTHLVNANAADKAGALSYLHTEVIPLNSRPPICTRKWGYDIIAIFEVTVFNPPQFPGGNGPNIGIGFSAMDGGKCTVPKCQEQFEANGFYVGGQTQKGNCRAAYGSTTGSAYWYSFPAEGQCAHPDGSKRCTYNARYVGKLKIDDLINSKGTQISPNFKDWCLAGGWEFQAVSRNCPVDTCTVVTSIDFWKSPCDVAACQKRVDMLRDAAKSDLVDYSIPNGCDGSTLKTFKYNGECVRDCPVNTYLDWGYNCIPCDPSLHCETCNWATMPPSESTGQGGTRCLTCSSEYPALTVDGRCLSSCPSGEYLDKDARQCLRCSSECSECSNSTACTRCTVSQWLLGGKCVADCPSGFFADINASSCAKCDSCGVNGSCANASFCTSCGEGSLMTPTGQCVTGCPEGTYLDGQTCRVCYSTCMNCSGPGETNCTMCDNATFAFEEGRCVTSCAPPSYKDAFQGRCVLCSDVIAGCSKCLVENGTSPTCTACGREPTLQYLHAGLCRASCPAGFVAKLDSSAYVCVPANPTMSPTSVPTISPSPMPTVRLALDGENENGIKEFTMPVIIASSAAFLVIAVLAFRKCQAYRHQKLLNSLEPQELGNYEQLS